MIILLNKIEQKKELINSSIITFQSPKDIRERIRVRIEIALTP